MIIHDTIFTYEDWEPVIGLEIHVQLKHKIETLQRRAQPLWR